MQGNRRKKKRSLKHVTILTSSRDSKKSSSSEESSQSLSTPVISAIILVVVFFIFIYIVRNRSANAHLESSSDSLPTRGSENSHPHVGGDARHTSENFVEPSAPPPPYSECDPLNPSQTHGHSTDLYPKLSRFEN